MITPGFINKALLNVKTGKEGMNVKSSVPKMLQPFTAWQNRLRKVEALCFFIGIWVESSPNCSFLLRPLKYFLMERKVSWLIEKKLMYPWKIGILLNANCHWGWMLSFQLSHKKKARKFEYF